LALDEMEGQPLLKVATEAILYFLQLQQRAEVAVVMTQAQADLMDQVVVLEVAVRLPEVLVDLVRLAKVMQEATL
jgi:hypothetical protein